MNLVRQLTRTIQNREVSLENFANYLHMACITACVQWRS